ncbi:MAG: polyprenyl synthetase family protein [Sporomusaceae bacterium]|jgi:geranylgeranyl diphosphate synthase type II|nr:polyprenyl synthetase family protein [Sporomusaceae bacterium]
MSENNLASYWQEKIVQINQELAGLISVPASGADLADYDFAKMHPPVIFEAMRYSLLAGGKRVRPLMLLAAAEAVGGQAVDCLPAACALEMIHAYSLIHDDLPAMDNDDYRRGKLTNHKVYGEGMAVLAGDALLTAAFEIILRQKNTRPEILLLVIKEIAQAAGAQGMVGGQAADLIAEGKKISAPELKYIHQAKTGALFKAALRAGALLGGAGAEELAALTKYAECFGLAFQITDDILDVTGDETKLGKPTGSDERNQKATYVTLYSLAGAKDMAAKAVDEAQSHLAVFGAKAWVLRELAQYLLTRQA